MINHFLKYDVCVIGAGITGLTSALELLKEGYKVIILEKDRNHINASRYNSGQILPGFSLDEISLSNYLGRHQAQTLWEFTYQGVGLIEKNLASFQDSLSLIPNSYFYLTHHAYVDRLFEQWEKYRNAYACQNKMQYFRAKELPSLFHTDYFIGGLKETKTYLLDSMRYMDNLFKKFSQLGGAIKYFAPHLTLSYLTRNSNNVKIRVNNRQSILSKYLVIATNGQLNCLSGLSLMNGYLFKTDRIKNIHLVPNLAFSIMSPHGYLHYCRYLEDNSILFCCKSLPLNYSATELVRMFSKEILSIFPFLGKVGIRDFSFSSIALTKHRLPEIGQLSPYIYYAQGYSGRGLVLGTLAGKAISESICGDDIRLSTLSKVYLREVACHA